MLFHRRTCVGPKDTTRNDTNSSAFCSATIILYAQYLRRAILNRATTTQMKWRIKERILNLT